MVRLSLFCMSKNALCDYITFLNLLPPIEVEELKGLIDNMVVIKITKGERQINKGEVRVSFQKEYMLICIITLKLFDFIYY